MGDRERVAWCTAIAADSALCGASVYLTSTSEYRRMPALVYSLSQPVVPTLRTSFELFPLLAVVAGTSASVCAMQ